MFVEKSKQNFFFHFRSSFSDFAQKYGRDDRFKGIEKMRERESLFNEFIVEVRRREKDEKQQKKEQVSALQGLAARIHLKQNVYVRVVWFAKQHS